VGQEMVLHYPEPRHQVDVSEWSASCLGYFTNGQLDRRLDRSWTFGKEINILPLLW